MKLQLTCHRRRSRLALRRFAKASRSWRCTIMPCSEKAQNQNRYPFTVIFLGNLTEIIGYEIDEMPGGGAIFSKLLRILDQSLQSGSRPAVQRYSTFRHCSSPIIVSMVRLRFHSPRACVWILLRPETESIETGWNRGWSIKQNRFFSLPEIFSALEWHRDANSCNSTSSWRMFASNVAFVGSPCCLRFVTPNSCLTGFRHFETPCICTRYKGSL